MVQSRWRRKSIAVIAQLEAEYKDKSYSAFKRALFDAYPFGERAYTPYKIWCEDQRAALARHPESPDYKPPMGDGLQTLDLFSEQAKESAS